MKTMHIPCLCSLHSDRASMDSHEHGQYEDMCAMQTYTYKQALVLCEVTAKVLVK